MHLKPGSDKRISWFFYRINRKLSVLRKRGTLFQKSPLRKHSGDSISTSTFWIILLNSTFIFLLSYLLVFLLTESATAIAAQTFNIKSVMRYYDVDFLIRSRDWTTDAVKVVFSSGPLIMFMLTFVTIFIFSIISHENWTIRLFIIWFSLHALTQSFGDLIFGTLLNQEFGWVLSYLYFDDTTKMLMVILSLLGMLASGILLSRYILLTGNIYFNNIRKGKRFPFLMSQFFLPYLIGIGIIISIKQPLMNTFEIILELSMLLILVPAILRARFSNDLFFDEEPKVIHINWGWISSSILAIILFRTCF